MFIRLHFYFLFLVRVCSFFPCHNPQFLTAKCGLQSGMRNVWVWLGSLAQFNKSEKIYTTFCRSIRLWEYTPFVCEIVKKKRSADSEQKKRKGRCLEFSDCSWQLRCTAGLGQLIGISCTYGLWLPRLCSMLAASFCDNFSRCVLLFRDQIFTVPLPPKKHQYWPASIVVWCRKLAANQSASVLYCFDCLPRQIFLNEHDKYCYFFLRARCQLNFSLLFRKTSENLHIRRAVISACLWRTNWPCRAEKVRL